jgi:hypothetical protein
MLSLAFFLIILLNVVKVSVVVLIVIESFTTPGAKVIKSFMAVIYKFSQ